MAEKAKKKRILVLCALPYTNAIPHVGNMAGSHLPADIFARYCRLRGYETLFVGGTDENGTPTEVAALELKATPRELTDALYAVQKRIYDWFEISYDNFSRTSRPIHHRTTQEFFLRIYGKGFVSKGVLRMPYCEKDRLFLPDRYVEGTCPVCGYEHARGDQCEHCSSLLDSDQLINPRCKIDGSVPVFRDTKHLFLELGKLQSKLEKWIKSEKRWRRQVSSLALGWIKEGLKKRSITRDLKWGVPVPLDGYRDKVFYVWFDAPIGYISSTREWAAKKGRPQAWKRFWLDDKAKIYNFLGKDNIPFHTIFWPGMLIAHGDYNLPYDVVGYQFVNYEGDKFSKSRNWGIFCERVVESELRPDVWRYYLTYLIPETKDSEFKWEDFESRVNNELVANLGNFVHRTLTFAWNNFGGVVRTPKYGEREKNLEGRVDEQLNRVERCLDEVKLRDALTGVLAIAGLGNEYFQSSEPWVLIKKDRESCEKVISFCLHLCRKLSVVLAPYTPEAAGRIASMLGLREIPSWDEISTRKDEFHVLKPEILFKKLDETELERVRSVVTKSYDLKEIFAGRRTQSHGTSISSPPGSE
ncbi:MAG: methionine--tRNA ligase [Thaumarchaeota archaeon]|nr:methionine--tRNA ligase [Nitrososphaerota archaeon]